MSVVVANSWGCVLDTRRLIDESVKRCARACDAATRTERFRCAFRRRYFDVLKPHIQAQQNTDAGRSETQSTGNDLKTRKKRKRKRAELNTGETDAHAYHEKIQSVVLEGSRALVDAGHQCGYFTEVVSPVTSERVSVQECELAALCDMARQLPLTNESDLTPVQMLNRDDLHAPLDLFSYITENPYDITCEVTLMSERYLLPPRSRFLLSDITRLNPLVNSGDKYDLIILDPPWENKSVKRSNRYSSLPSSQLKKLPVPPLAAPGCVVVTWVTNRARHLRFVREELYPHWGVEVLAEWLWVKVTRAGEFVFPLDSQHKKPYEVLVLGRYGCSADPTLRHEIPNHHLVMSVPSLLHSHKPSLSVVLKPYIRPNPQCLELFARSLQPDWTSWGNEVIKFQHISYFTSERAEDPPSPSDATHQPVSDSNTHLMKVSD